MSLPILCLLSAVLLVFVDGLCEVPNDDGSVPCQVDPTTGALSHCEIDITPVCLCDNAEYYFPDLHACDSNVVDLDDDSQAFVTLRSPGFQPFSLELVTVGQLRNDAAYKITLEVNHDTALEPGFADRTSPGFGIGNRDGTLPQFVGFRWDGRNENPASQTPYLVSWLGTFQYNYLTPSPNVGEYDRNRVAIQIFINPWDVVLPTSEGPFDVGTTTTVSFLDLDLMQPYVSKTLDYNILQASQALHFTYAGTNGAPEAVRFYGAKVTIEQIDTAATMDDDNDQGGGCDSIDLLQCQSDLTACIEEVDECNMSLQGATSQLNTCNTDLASCEANRVISGDALTVCEDELVDTTTNLDSCSTNLADSDVALSSCQDDLLGTIADLDQCTAALADSETELSLCEQNLQTTNVGLEDCTQDVDECSVDLATCTTECVNNLVTLATGLGLTVRRCDSYQRLADRQRDRGSNVPRPLQERLALCEIAYPEGGYGSP